MDGAQLWAVLWIKPTGTGAGGGFMDRRASKQLCTLVPGTVLWIGEQASARARAPL